MGTLGIVLISAYFAISIVIGLWASRKQTAEGFLLGDRKVSSLSTFATIAASKADGGFLLVLVTFVYLYDMGAIWYLLGAVAGFWVFYLFAKNRLKDEADKNQYYTLADYVFKNYGKTAGYLAATLALLKLTFSIIVQLTAGSKALFEITGFSFNVSLVLITSVVFIYLIAGGFKAVVKTDFFQYIVILVLLLIMLFSLTSIWKVDREYLDPWSSGLGNIPMFIILGVLTPFFQPAMFQRIYATKNKKTLKRGFLMSMTIYPLMIFIMILIGLVIKTHMPEADPEIAFIKGLIHLLPVYFLGIGGVLMFSAVMSSTDTYIFTSSSVFLQDFVLRNKKVSKEQTVKYFRITMAVIIVLAAIASYLLKSVIVSTYLWATIGIVLGVGIITTWLFRRISGFALTLGYALGLIVFIVVSVTGSFTPLVVGYALVSTLAGLIIGSIISKFFIKNK